MTHKFCRCSDRATHQLVEKFGKHLIVEEFFVYKIHDKFFPYELSVCEAPIHMNK